MKIGSKSLLVLGLGAALCRCAAAEDKPAQPTQLKDLKEKVSYGIGMNIGGNLKRGNYDVDVELISAAIKDVLAGRDTKMTETEARDALMTYQKEQNAKRMEERAKMAEKNRAEGEQFLAANKKKPGVKTVEVKLPSGTNAELQYKVITEGKGETPKATDLVSVNYRGTFINGKEFDSNIKPGGVSAPYKCPVKGGIIQGWTEALQLMKTGSKWELYLPASLAYGDNGFGQKIEPGSTLLFELELLGVEAPPAATPQQPLTSDIIRVPSAEELKNGAKIEVIKPEDVEKKLRESTNNAVKK
jgi:FKBP-type peptidyl-prolyl cis-trans isomerase FklB